MTIGSLHRDAGGHSARSAGRAQTPRRSVIGPALTAVVLAAMSLGAQASPDPATHAPVRTAPLTMSPARIDLSDKRPTVMVTVHNDDVRAAMIVRMQPMMWTQDGIAPHYELTSDVVAQPATFVVAAGATQTVQVDLLSSTNSVRGQDFELFWEAQATAPGWHRNDERPAP